VGPVSSREYQRMLVRLRRAQRDAGLSQVEVVKRLGGRHNRALRSYLSTDRASTSARRPPRVLPLLAQGEDLPHRVVPEALGRWQGRAGRGARFSAIRARTAHQLVPGIDLAEQEGERLRPAA